MGRLTSIFQVLHLAWLGGDGLHANVRDCVRPSAALAPPDMAGLKKKVSVDWQTMKSARGLGALQDASRNFERSTSTLVFWTAARLPPLRSAGTLRNLAEGEHLAWLGGDGWRASVLDCVRPSAAWAPPDMAGSKKKVSVDWQTMKSARGLGALPDASRNFERSTSTLAFAAGDAGKKRHFDLIWLN